MPADFKKCPNGHYYQGDTCPYCNTSATMSGGKTQVFGGGGGGTLNMNPGGGATQPMGPNGTRTQVVGGGGNRTQVVGDQDPTIVAGGAGAPAMSNKTVFGGDYDETKVDSLSGDKAAPRNARKLVGWLVSYTLDEMGVDFKLYEGRNIIGRDMDCNITVSDQMVSGKHAVILFRAGKYSITDQQSSHGTFVNGEDIELEPRYIKDNDEIRIGETLFLFRTAFKKEN